jgi:hypothetical protein
MLAEPDPGPPLLRWLDPRDRPYAEMAFRSRGTPAERCRAAIDWLRERVLLPDPTQNSHAAHVATFEAMLRHPKEAMEYAAREGT